MQLENIEGIVIPYAIEIYIPQDEARKNGYTFNKKTTIASEILEMFEPDEKQCSCGGIFFSCRHLLCLTVNYEAMSPKKIQLCINAQDIQ